MKEGEVAVFVCNMGGQQQIDYIEGPFDKTLESENLPLTATFKELLSGESSLKQAELYFINVQGINQMKFGVPYFHVIDPRQPQLPVPVAVRGTIDFTLADYRTFIRQAKLQDTSLEDLRQKLRPVISKVVKEVVTVYPEKTGTLLIQMERHASHIANAIRPEITQRLSEHGIQLRNLDVSAIECDKESSEYQELYSLTQGMSSELQRARQQDTIERIRIQREEEQRAMRMATESANLGAHYIDKQAETIQHTASKQAEAVVKSASVQADAVKAGLENMHKIAGDGGYWYGRGDSMAGMMMAGVMAQQMGQAMNGQMGGNTHGTNPAYGVGQMQGVGIQSPIAGSQGSTPTGTTMPPPLNTQYFVAVNGQQAGPFSIQQLQQMINTGQLTMQSFVWKQGMAQWDIAANVQELSSLFGMPPTPPPFIPNP